jgi:predicted benzoate:H+ symporter BenE
MKVPSWAEIVHGTENAVLPQIPLTLTNAIIVTAAVSRQLFPHEVHPVTERNLALTTGLGNLLAAPFGGYLMCHGAGGIAVHVRFGARTATAPVLIGLVFVLLGIGFGESGYALLKTIPNAVLGSLLLFSGLELALSSKPQEYRDADLFLVLLVLVQSERDLMGIAAALLTEAGVADRWEQAGVTVAELSEQLLMTAKGIKGSVDTLTAYRERMLTAIRIVMRNP